MKLNSCLYAGSVGHYRTRPKKHTLRYSLFLFLIDLSELDDLDRRFKWFSRNRFNLFTFKDSDFGEPGKSLQNYIASKLHDAGLSTNPARVQLLCSPRMLGYSFNPLSVFYCFDADDNLYATVYEVHNTFHERHTYVLNTEQVSSSGWITQTCEKAMYVSPFVPARMTYFFRLKAPAAQMDLSIKVDDENGTMVGAGLQGQRCVISDGLLLKNFVVYPLMTLKVIGGIHFEALRLWLKGVKWFKYLPKSRLYINNPKEQ